jgi:CRISPR-associated protein Csd1
MPGSKGAFVVSFNEESSCLPGKEQGENAPTSRAAAEGYAAALNWLLERAPPRRHRQGVSLEDNNVLVYWAKAPNSVEEAISSFVDPYAKGEVAELMRAPFYPSASTEVDETAFFAAVLGTNQTRVVVRTWIDTTVSALKKNILAYLDALEVAGNSYIPSVGVICRVLELKPPMRAALVKAAFNGTPLPRELAVAALRAIHEEDGACKTRTCVAVLKAFLQHSSKESLVSLDETKRDSPYVLGRLFSLLNTIQYQAHEREVVVNLRDRWFRSASATPAAAFPRLLSLSVSHIKKLHVHGFVGKAVGYERDKRALLDMLPTTPLPRTHSLEDQSLFILGYYHQEHAKFAAVAAYKAKVAAATGIAAPNKPGPLAKD